MIMKIWLPNALLCGCSYDLFWHLNPKKLEPFYKAKLKEYGNIRDLNHLASHQSGLYVRLAVASCFSKNNRYPEVPLGMEENVHEDSECQAMSDADRFAAFAAAHRAAIKKKRKLETGG